jgi:hypothetical protein
MEKMRQQRGKSMREEGGEARRVGTRGMRNEQKVLIAHGEERKKRIFWWRCAADWSENM